MASAQPTTIPDPSTGSAASSSEHVMVIVLVTLLSTGVVCIVCTCYIVIRRRNRAALVENNNVWPGREVEAARRRLRATNMTETRTNTRRYFSLSRADGSISQTALTGPGAAAAAHSSRSGSALDRRASLNSSMWDGYSRSPAGSTFEPRIHQREGEDDSEARRLGEMEEEDLPEPPPRYETAVEQPPAVEN
jgi:hypothetical protein